MKKSIKLSSSRYQIRYTEEFKRYVCKEYLSGQGSKNGLAKKHGIGGGSSRITKWLRLFGYEDTPPSPTYFTPNLSTELKEAAKEKKIREELEDEIRLLRKQLEDKCLQAEMYSKMIDIAEDELGIDIRKKSNTK